MLRIVDYDDSNNYRTSMLPPHYLYNENDDSKLNLGLFNMCNTLIAGIPDTGTSSLIDAAINQLREIIR